MEMTILYLFIEESVYGGSKQVYQYISEYLPIYLQTLKGLHAQYYIDSNLPMREESLGNKLLHLYNSLRENDQLINISNDISCNLCEGNLCTHRKLNPIDTIITIIIM